MRTTLSLDDDVLELTRRIAREREMSLSEAANYLIRRGLEPRIIFDTTSGFPVFNVGPTNQTFGPEDVQRALDEEDAKYAAFFLKGQAK
jgi:hypothetical protein